MDKTWVKVGLVTIIIGGIASYIGPIIWPPSPIHVPPPEIYPYLIATGVAEALAFGLGVAFLIWGWQALKKTTLEPKGAVTALFWSTAWLVMAWWPHDSIHGMVGFDFHKLIYIEYGFHMTLLAAAVIAGSSFIKIMRRYIKREKE